jgi:putative aldouronate transport system permease protein
MKNTNHAANEMGLSSPTRVDKKESSLFGKIAREIKAFNKNLPLFLLSLPGLLFVVIFSYIPMFGVILAFKKYNFNKGFWGSDWVGFKNFKFFFTSEKAFEITKNTMLYNLAFIVIITATALLFALLLNELGRKMVKLYQTVIFLPYFLSWVVVSYIVFAFLDHQNGFLNKMLVWSGLEAIQWYREPVYWPIILTFTHLWKTVGFSTLVYYAGIIGIDNSYYEAARIDGASRWQMMRNITLPLLIPLIVILFIIAIGSIIRADFGLFFIVPSDSAYLYHVTDVIDTYVYRALRGSGDIGMSTAVGLYQSVVGFIMVMGSNYLIKRINSENALL